MARGLAIAGRRAVSGEGPVLVAPGEDLLHPVAVSAFVLLVVNDHLLKGSAVPAVLTGKLSDVAGLVLLPLLLRATWEWGSYLFGFVRHTGRRRRSWLPVAITAVAFTAIHVSESAAGLYGRTLGFLQWLPAAVWAAVSGHSFPPILIASYVLDLTDLLVLPVCVVPAWLMGRSARRHALHSRVLAV